MDCKRVRKFTWKIENFSTIKLKKLYSNTFFVGGNKWQVAVILKGDHFSVYLDVADSATLPRGWSRYAQFRFSVINQIDPGNSISKARCHDFNAKRYRKGFRSFLPLSELHDPNKGYLINDACLAEADVSTDRTIDLMSYEFVVETDYDELMDKEADHGRDGTDSTDNELPTIQPSSLTEKSSKFFSFSPFLGYMATEPEDPPEEDIDTFFTSLESELASHNLDSSQEAAKEALAKIEEALNMTPANFYETEKFSPLKEAFKVLTSSDCCSALTTGQKIELLAMEKNFKELPERVVKAMQGKNLVSEKESVKQTLNCNLKKSLNIFKENKAQLKQVEQRIVALLEQLEEEQKNKMKILACRKENFKTTKNMKIELETLGKEWPEYEAKAKAAEEEERTVAATWSKMKYFVSSLKERFRKGAN